MDNILSSLEAILEQRKSESAKDSYVASLYNQGTDQILKKIAEESAEVIMAAKSEGNDKIIHEVADLWFHVLVLLRHKNISVSDIETELVNRFGISGLEEKNNRMFTDPDKGFVLVGDGDILIQICKGVFFKTEDLGICMVGKKK